MEEEHYMLKASEVIRKWSWEVDIRHPLKESLSDLANLYSNQGKLAVESLGLKLKDGDKTIEFKSILDCKITDLLPYATPSFFGKGSETVFDESVRKGKEIKADRLELLYYSKYDKKSISNYLEEIVNNAMPKEIFHHDFQPVVRFCKLAIYEEGGHFVEHKDTTHADSHIATLLIALKSEHTGGDLLLRLGDETNGEKVRWSTAATKEQLESEEEYAENKFCLFYTDVNHQVEAVTSGLRAVLQFDVLVPDDAPSLAKKAKISHHQQQENDDNDNEEEEEDGEEVEEDMEEEEEEDEDEEQENYFDVSYYSTPKTIALPDDVLLIPKQKTLQTVVQKIAQYITDTNSLALPLAHAYRARGIVPKYLKCYDKLLFQALVEAGYRVILTPIELEAIGNGEETANEFEYYARPFDFDKMVGYFYPLEEGTEGAAVGASEVTARELQTEPIKTTAVPPGVVYAATRYSSLVNIHHQSYCQYTGNESQPSEDRYFSGAMIVYKALAKPEKKVNRSYF